MAKKIEQNTEAPEIAYNFPSVLIDGVEGKTIFARSQQEAEEKLNLLLNKKSND